MTGSGSAVIGGSAVFVRLGVVVALALGITAPARARMVAIEEPADVTTPEGEATAPEATPEDSAPVVQTTESTAPESSSDSPSSTEPVTSTDATSTDVTSTDEDTSGGVVGATPADPSIAQGRMLDDLLLGQDDSGLDDAVWISLGVFAGDVRNDAITMGSLDLGLRLAIASDARVSLDWGVAFADTRVRGAYNGATIEPFDARQSRVEGRNADLRFEWLPLVARDVRFGFGVGVAVPVAATTRLPSDAASQADFDASSLVHEGYLASNVGYRAWRYRPERVAVYVPLMLAIALSDTAVLAFDGAAALGARVLGGMGDELLGDLVLGAELGAEVASFLRVGARAQVAALALGTTVSSAQPSVEGWTRIELAPVSVLVRASLGLGGPYGAGSDFVGWGLHAGAGATF